MISKKQLAETLALSCVENYFLAWISRFYDPDKLFARSFIPLKKLFDDFSCGQSYENYSGICRIQDFAEQCKITEHSFFKVQTLRALETVMGQDEEELCLISVNETFFRGLKRRAWRDDHFICIDKDLNWVNEYPLSDGKFTQDEFGRIYGGTVCVYRIKDDNAVPCDEAHGVISVQCFDGINFEMDLENLENALGVLRVSRKRMERFYVGRERLCKAFSDEVAVLDKLYLSIRLERIRRRGERNKIYDAVKGIIDLEKEIAEIIK